MGRFVRRVLFIFAWLPVVLLATNAIGGVAWHQRSHIRFTLPVLGAAVVCFIVFWLFISLPCLKRFIKPGWAGLWQAALYASVASGLCGLVAAIHYDGYVLLAFAYTGLAGLIEMMAILSLAYWRR